jgi:hypothetical protein
MLAPAVYSSTSCVIGIGHGFGGGPSTSTPARFSRRYVHERLNPAATAMASTDAPRSKLSTNAASVSFISPIAITFLWLVRARPPGFWVRGPGGRTGSARPVRGDAAAALRVGTPPLGVGAVGVKL